VFNDVASGLVFVLCNVAPPTTRLLTAIVTSIFEAKDVGVRISNGTARFAGTRQVWQDDVSPLHDTEYLRLPSQRYKYQEGGTGRQIALHDKKLPTALPVVVVPAFILFAQSSVPP
jgi:hypothetical protein